jgi:hypothetical protein
MLYKKNAEKTLSDALFRSPTAEYRGTPFWAWNSFLTKEELCRQIDVFKEMGLGGFHMHVRTGLKNPYMDADFLELVKACVAHAKENEMLAWLYDEDRWPSGAAGGLVTKDPQYRARCLLFTNALKSGSYQVNDSRAEGGRSENGKVIAAYDVRLNPKGELESYARIGENDEAEGEKWYAMLEIHQPSSWYNDQTYADTLNKAAIERFIEVTHEAYAKAVGDEFDKTVPAIFTDEPQFTRKKRLLTSFAAPETDVTLPWTDSVPAGFQAAYGYDILDYLPEIFWELPEGKVSVHRYRYHDYITELFAVSFADTVGGWCKAHHISLTGHMMEEPTLRSQTAAIGEAMRSYRGFGLPGIDLLCNSHEFTTAKQCQSAVHQFGREGMLSELYGVTGWDCDFRTYRHQGDWQACLGVTVRVPHLSWYAMHGEAKRDYPASISYQSPWYKEYSAVEDHFARVNAALTRGKPIVKVGVIHPVESYWLHWGPNDKTATACADMDDRFLSLATWLLEGCVDFHYVSESLLPTLCEEGGAPLKVGEMAYDTLIVPACETLRSTTLDRLEAFKAAGGRLIFLGKAPSLVDALPDDRGRALYEQSENVEYARAAVLQALEPEKLVDIRYLDGRAADRYMYQLRQDTDGRWLFIAHTKEPGNKDLSSRAHVILRLKGEFAPVLYDTETGDITPIGADYENGCTVIRTVLYGYDSLLLKLLPGRAEAPAAFPEETNGKRTCILRPESITPDEPNVLLLDRAEYALDGGDFAPAEEILRLDNICRRALGFRPRGGQVVQPWARQPETITHSITLKFTFESEIAVSGACLALEDADKARITLNGEAVPNDVIGNYVDIEIYKVALPEIKKGRNVLTVTWPFGRNTDVENCFILGNFAVKTEGETAKITGFDTVSFGDLTQQGFPFYGGNVTYRFPVELPKGKGTLRVSDYKGALMKVAVDGVPAGRIIYPPYDLPIEAAPGKHEIEITLYLHRYNTFGPLHLVNEHESWHGPGAWRSENENWSEQYVLRRTGIMKSPEIFIGTE